MYRVNDLFYTLQGEGYWSGRAAVFCRFSRCNLWSGLEEDRASAICSFCDTDFVSGTEYDAAALAAAIRSAWPRRYAPAQPMVVFTGGEPALQLDQKLLDELGYDWYVAVETNGTLPLKADVDWVCVSPKTPRVNITSGDELKLVYPQQGRMQPETYQDLDFGHFWLSPMDPPDDEDHDLMWEENTAAAVEYVKQHPQWRLNTQTHKQIGIP